MIIHFLQVLPPPYDTWEFEFFGKRLKGQTEKLPQERVALQVVEKLLDASLGDLFAKKYVSPIVKQECMEIAKEIKRGAMHVAGSTTWLEPATRQKAMLKVKNIHLNVAYPTVPQKDIKTKLDPENMLKNIFALSALEFKNEMKKINTILEPYVWEDTVFAVNAYYYSEGNRLFLPSGILRWPFFHPNASDGWNFGGLGASIGHEISHAFDNDGNEYDENGNKHSWWSKQESERYAHTTKDLIELFNKTQYVGEYMNGELTLSENIADLGGLAIALSSLKERLSRKKVLGDKYKDQLRDFFISYAVSWRSKEKKKKALQGLFMDVHSPSPLRVNNIVCQFDD